MMNVNFFDERTNIPLTIFKEDSPVNNLNIKNVTLNDSNSIVNELSKALDNEYKKFNKVPAGITNRFEACKKQLETVDTKQDYLDFLTAFKNAIIFACDASRNVRRELLEKILDEDRFKSQYSKLKEDDIFKSVEYNSFKKTEVYKEIRNYIINIFNSIDTSVDFEALKIKNVKDIEELKTNVLEKAFTGISENETTEKNIGEYFEVYEGDIISGKKEKKKEASKNVKLDDILSGQIPKILKALIKRCFEKLNDFDKTILKYFQNNAAYQDFTNSEGMILRGTTSYMSNEGIVCLCGLACNKFLPPPEDEDYSEEDVDEEDNDVELELQKIVYKSGSSNATIHYGQPASKRRDSQFFELRISPAVMLKSEKGRASIVIRTFKNKEEDDMKLVTKHGKLMSVFDTIQFLLNGDDEFGGSRSYGRRR